MKNYENLYKRRGDGMKSRDYIYENKENLFKEYLKDLGLSIEDLKGKNILDLGAGKALFAQKAKEYGFSVVSFDKYPELKKLSDVPYVKGDAYQLPFYNNAFDLILSRAAFNTFKIEQINQLRVLVSEINRVLREGGELRFGPGTIHLEATTEDYSKESKQNLWLTAEQNFQN